MGTRARWLTVLVIVLMLAAGVPAGWSAAQEGEERPSFGEPGPSVSFADLQGGEDEFSAAFTPIEQRGIRGDIIYVDSAGAPGAYCGTYVYLNPVEMDIVVNLPAVYPSGNFAQEVAIAVGLFQVLPDGLAFLGQTDLFFGVAFPSAPADFPALTLFDLPVGPTYLTAVAITWLDPFGFEEGFLAYGVDYYESAFDDGSGWQSLGVDSAGCYSVLAPFAILEPTQGVVNSGVLYGIEFFPLDVPVTVLWDTTVLGTTFTDDSGISVGSFPVPASPMGSHTISFEYDEWVATRSYSVIPRIKLTPGEAARGDTIGVSLRGYKARETVRIRWLRDGSWVELARVPTSGTGSANLNVEVPDWAPVGPNSVRGDSTSPSGGRAQTNAFSVDDVPLPELGTLLLSSNRGTVNSRVTATVGSFPANEMVTVTFRGYYEATASAMTDATGAATMSFNVPASPKGVFTVEAAGGNVEATATYEIVPRIKLTPGQGARGDTVGVSLRGYGAREVVRIRWKIDGTFEQLTTVTTSSSGSANVNISVPLSALDGPASVRGDGPIGRAQTNAFDVSGGPFEPATVEEASPIPTATPTETPAPASPTVEPTVTEEPTQEPMATATQEPPADPTPTTEAPADPPAEASPSPETTEETTT